MNAWLKNALWFTALALGAWGIEYASTAGLNRYWVNVLGDLGIAAIMAVSLNLIVEASLIRENVLIHERLQTPLQVLHFAAEREIHFCRLFSLLVRDFSPTHTV